MLFDAPSAEARGAGCRERRRRQAVGSEELAAGGAGVEALFGKPPTPVHR